MIGYPSFSVLNLNLNWSLGVVNLRPQVPWQALPQAINPWILLIGVDIGARKMEIGDRSASSLPNASKSSNYELADVEAVTAVSILKVTT